MRVVGIQTQVEGTVSNYRNSRWTGLLVEWNRFRVDIVFAVFIPLTFNLLENKVSFRQKKIVQFNSHVIFSQ